MDVPPHTQDYGCPFLRCSKSYEKVSYYRRLLPESLEQCQAVLSHTDRLMVAQRYEPITREVNRRSQIAYDRPSSASIKTPYTWYDSGGRSFYKKISLDTDLTFGETKSRNLFPPDLGLCIGVWQQQSRQHDDRRIACEINPKLD